MIRKIAPGLVLCGLGTVGPLGCMTNRADTLDSRLFIVPSVTQIDVSPAPARTRASEVVDNVRPSPVMGEIPKNATVLPDPSAVRPRPFDAIEPIGELTSNATTQPSVTQSLDPVASTPAAVPASAVEAPPVFPTTVPSTTRRQDQTFGGGVYMTLGGVIAIVDGTPIYTSEVLAPLKRRFAVKARELNVRQFQRYAAREIELQLHERIESELRFARAYHSLNEEDKSISESEAMEIRKRRVRAAGGSVEEARRIAADAGEDFDESIKQEYRLVVIEIFVQRQQSMILVSADAMRDFYKQNLAKLYSTKAQAQFRVIEIDPDHYKDLATARQKAEAIRYKAAGGADFSVMAASDNDDNFLKSRGGWPMDPGQWMERNTFMVDAVDTAVWELQPGQVTPVIEAKNKLYVAKMEARRGGTVQPFEDQTVQADVYEKVWRAQRNRVAQQVPETADQWDSLDTDEKRAQVALDIAMQQYAQVQGGEKAMMSSTGH